MRTQQRILAVSWLFALAGISTLTAQTIFVPGGTVGTSTNDNVGIGTSSPGNKLQVAGSGEVMATVGSSSALTLYSNTGAAPAIYWTSGNRLRLGTTTDGISTSGWTEKACLDSNGNLGIGTTVPTRKLDVYGGGIHVRWLNQVFASGTGSSDQFLLEQSGSGNADGTTNITAFSHRVGLTGTNAASRLLGNYFSSRMLATNTLTSLQGLGIGLQLESSGNVTNATCYTTYLPISSSGNITGTLVYFQTSAPFVTSTGDITGNIIGFQTPNMGRTVAVDVIAFYAADQTKGLGNAVAFRGLMASGTGKFNLYMDGSAANYLAGNVGIGTTNPTYPLTVNGTVRAKEVIVDTGWSDYVFKPDYHLASLSEVERAIKRDGHLPGVPSGAQVAKEGISVGDMQSRLLAKIEELTLHVIQQEKEIQSLKAELARVSAQE